nr:protein FAM71E2-like [Pogona vitticeps]
MTLSKNRPSGGDAPLPGKLRRVLQRAEYNMLDNAPIFEGNFVQVTRKGECISIHNHPHIVTMGVLATSPTLPLPNLMIIAREKQRRGAKRPKAKDLEITRLVPLEMVELRLHSLKERMLKVQIRTGQKYYLQLYAPGRDATFLFDQWLRLIYLIYIARGRIRQPASITPKESRHHVLQKSSLGLSKKHWLPAIMEEGSTGHLKEQLCQLHSSTETQSSAESQITSKQGILKSGSAAFSSRSSFDISGSEGHASKGPSLYTDPEVRKRSQPKTLVASQAGSPSFYRPEVKRQSKQTSPQSMGMRSLESATRPEGTGFPHPQVRSLPVGPSAAARQMSAKEPFQLKKVRLPSVTEPEEVLISMTLPKSKHVPIKLQKSKKSDALARSHGSKRKKAAVKSHEATPVPPKSLKSPSQDRRGVASKTSSTKPKPLSRPVSARAASASPAPVDQTSVGVGPSETHLVSVASGPSEAFVVSAATASSWSTSQGTQAIPEMCGTEVAPTKGQSEGKTHACPSQKSGKQSKSASSRPKVSSIPFPKQGRSTSSNPTKKGNLVALHRTEESVAVGPSTADNLFTSRSQSRASKDKSHGKKKDSSRPSSATGKQKASRSEETESNTKLKQVLSAAKQKSSVTFLTIYSVLSSSFDRVKRSVSRDDAKPLSRNPSKRVTISGVVGPSGKSFSQQEEVRDSAEDRPSASRK